MEVFRLSSFWWNVFDIKPSLCWTQSFFHLNIVNKTNKSPISFLKWNLTTPLKPWGSALPRASQRTFIIKMIIFQGQGAIYVKHLHESDCSTKKCSQNAAMPFVLSYALDCIVRRKALFQKTRTFERLACTHNTQVLQICIFIRSFFHTHEDGRKLKFAHRVQFFSPID